MPEKTERKLNNWMESFLAWTLPRSESPYSILYWCGLYSLSSTVRRHVKIGKEYLGGWECYPNLYILFIGPQGMVKKSTSINFVEELLDGVGDEELSKAPDGVTIADLLQRVQNASESSVYILSSEFSTLVNKAGLGIYDILTDIFDGKKKIDEGTISRGYIFAANPCLNLLGATTPKWVGANMTEDIIGGGFGSRVIFIFEDTPRQRVLYYKNLIRIEDMDQLGKDLINDLKHIANIRGDFRITDDAYVFMEHWYRENAEAPAGTDHKLVGYYQRRPAHIHKVAMLLHLAETDSLILDVPDFERAIKVLADIEPKIAGTFKAIGRNVYANDMQSIVKYMKEKKKVSRTELLRVFYSAAEPNKLDEILTGLIQLETIKIDTVDRALYYEFMEDL